MRWFRCLASVVLVGSMSVWLASPAEADDFGYPPLWVADDSEHNYCYANVTDSTRRGQIADSMAYLDAVTDLMDLYNSTCQSYTDAVWAEADLDGARGEATCVAWAYWGICDQVWVVYDVGRVLSNSAECSSSPSDSYAVNIIKTMRHELGHSAGLTHGPPPSQLCFYATGTDAMRSGWVPTYLSWTTYNDHHRDHINFQYN